MRGLHEVTPKPAGHIASAPAQSSHSAARSALRQPRQPHPSRAGPADYCTAYGDSNNTQISVMSPSTECSAVTTFRNKAKPASEPRSILQPHHPRAADPPVTSITSCGSSSSPQPAMPRAHGRVTSAEPPPTGTRRNVFVSPNAGEAPVSAGDGAYLARPVSASEATPSTSLLACLSTRSPFAAARAALFSVAVTRKLQQRVSAISATFKYLHSIQRGATV